MCAQVCVRKSRGRGLYMDVGVPLLRTMPARGTHSRRPSASTRGLHFRGNALKVLSTQLAMSSADMGGGGIDLREKVVDWR